MIVFTACAGFLFAFRNLAVAWVAVLTGNDLGPSLSREPIYLYIFFKVVTSSL